MVYYTPSTKGVIMEETPATNVPLTDSSPFGADLNLARLYKFRPPYLDNFFIQLAKGLNLTNSSEILDICCGNGQLAVGLQKYVHKIVAVDGSKEMLEHAPSFSNIAYLHADVNSPTLIDTIGGQKFDHFVLGRAIHWIEKDALKLLSDNNLNSNGYIVVAASLFSRRTPWLNAFMGVRNNYGADEKWDFSGTKVEEIGYILKDQILLHEKFTCDFDYLVKHAMSFAISYEKISADSQNFRELMEKAMKPFEVDGKYEGLIVNWADIYAKHPSNGVNYRF